jgi:hypothetical protein
MHSPAIPRPISIPPALQGMALGILTAFIWGANQSAARYGIANGLGPFDLAALRFGAAGLVLAPWLLRQGLRNAAGVGWGRALIITLLVGPPFFMLNVGGYVFAPLAHGAVILPASFTIASLALASLVLAERQTPARLLGVATMIIGISLIVGAGLWRCDVHVGRAVMGERNDRDTTLVHSATSCCRACGRAFGRHLPSCLCWSGCRAGDP